MKTLLGTTLRSIFFTIKIGKWYERLLCIKKKDKKKINH